MCVIIYYVEDNKLQKLQLPFNMSRLLNRPTMAGNIGVVFLIYFLNL